MTELHRESYLGPYRVEAFNASKESENKIHDDTVARRFGFRGGLVPGVDVYAYMTHLPVLRWGRAWLERGTAECRLLRLPSAKRSYHPRSVRRPTRRHSQSAPTSRWTRLA
jgi:hypothetical protein